MNTAARLFSANPEGERLLQPADATTYLGIRCAMAFRVLVMPGGDELPARLDLANHSPTGFSWGYDGSGPAQLALALLAHASRDDAQALRLYQAFKTDTIAQLDQDRGWKLTAGGIRTWIGGALRRGAGGANG